ncbi:hypothetical protein AAKU55_000427 [Oxalobacteraceae bacterium GrIS 1.11]
MSVCGRCGAVFGCAMADRSPADANAGEPCWCTALPPVVALPAQGGACWCPACLQHYIAAQQAGAPQ